MMKKIILIMTVLLSVLAVDAKPPKWVKKRPVPTNQTFYYVIGKGYARNRDVALKKSEIDVKTTIAETLGVAQEVDLSSSFSLDSSKDGEATISSNESFAGKAANNIKKKKVDTYDEISANGEYIVYVLYQVAASANVTPLFDAKLSYK